MKAQLPLSIKIGDEQAFELLFHNYYVKLCGFTYKFLNEPEETKRDKKLFFINNR
jgi:hypothetical protein